MLGLPATDVRYNWHEIGISVLDLCHSLYSYILYIKKYHLAYPSQLED